MRASLSDLCRRFIENRDSMKAAFPMGSPYLHPICAAILSDKGQVVSAERLRECRDLLREGTGLFSNFRSTARLAMIAMMAADSDPQGKLDRALQVYEALKEYFWSSQYLPVAAMVVADAVGPARYDEISARTRRIYEQMKEEHPFLTSGEDSVFAALLALSPLSEEQVVTQAEECYDLLKPEFFSANAVQSLSHVLALGQGGAEKKCGAVLQLYQALKAQGCSYGTGYELATLDVLALLEGEQAAVVADLVETDGFLSRQKGYGLLGVGKKQRLMHAGMLVTSDYMGRSDAMSTAAVGATISLIAAQQAAICAAIAASSVAAASSANAGGN